MTVLPVRLIADGSATAEVVVTVRTFKGYPVPNVMVELSAVGAQVDFARAKGTTTRDGTFMTTLSASGGGQAMLTANTPDGASATASLDVEERPVPCPGAVGLYPTRKTFGLARTVVAGDLDANGLPELLIGSDAVGSLSVERNRGVGMFSADASYALDTMLPVVAVTADFDRDGRLDVAATNGLLRGGSGAALGELEPYPGAGSLVPLAIADLDGNVTHDLIAERQDADGIRIVTLLGDGHGAFADPIADDVAANTLDAVATGDINGDGMIDLVTAGYEQPPTGYDGRTVSVRLGLGNGQLGPRRFVSNAGDAQHVAVGDVNNDGKLDIATAHVLPPPDSGNLQVSLGRGDGTFEAPTVVSTFRGWSIAVADLNRDGNLDLISGNGNASPQVAVAYGHGTGVFTLATTVPTSGVNGSQTGVTLADFDGDGSIDIAAFTAYERGDVLVDLGCAP